MEAIYWTSIGLLLLVTELFVPSGMYLLIIGLAVLLTGFLSWIGVFTSLGYESLNSQIVVASALSIVMMFTIRKWISNLFNTYSKKTNSNITDQIVTALEQINPNETGKGELLGTIWNVRNDTKSIIQKDSKNKVKQIEGVTLIIGE